MLGRGAVFQLMKMSGQVLVGLESTEKAEGLSEEGLTIGNTLLKVFPYRKRAEKIVVGNLPIAIRDEDIVTALRPYSKAANSLVLSAIYYHLQAYLPSEATIARLQARFARFVWGHDRTSWLPSSILARPISVGGMGLLVVGTHLRLTYLKDVQAALRGGLNAHSWLAESGMWLSPASTPGTWLPSRRRRSLHLFEAAAEILELNHRILQPALLQTLRLVGDCRFLRPPELLAPTRWLGWRIGELTGSPPNITIVTRGALADAAALGSFCSRLVTQNARGRHRVASLADAIVVRGTTTAFQRLTTCTAAACWSVHAWLHCPSPSCWDGGSPTSASPSSSAGLLSGDVPSWDTMLTLPCGWPCTPFPIQHIRPQPGSPASPVGPETCHWPHRYWSCRRIRPVILEAFTIIQRPPDLQSWIFGHDLEDDALAIMASAKTGIYKHFWAWRCEESKKTPPRLAEDLIKLKNNRQQQDLSKARSAAASFDQCCYIEYCADFSPVQYIKALEEMLGKGAVFQLMKMSGQVMVGLANVDLADRLVEEGLTIGATFLRAFTYRQRPEKIVVGNLPLAIKDEDVIAALRPTAGVSPWPMRPAYRKTRRDLTKVGGSKKRPHDPDHVKSGAKKDCVQAPGMPLNSSRPQATPRPSKVHECQTTKQKQATFRARSAAGQAYQCVYLEFCPDFTPEQYFRALEAKLGKGTIYQLTKMEGDILAGFSSVQLADKLIELHTRTILPGVEAKLDKGTIYQLQRWRHTSWPASPACKLADKLIEEGLDIEDATLRAFPLRKRAERIVLGNVLFFVEEADLVATLRPYGQDTKTTEPPVLAPSTSHLPSRPEPSAAPEEENHPMTDQWEIQGRGHANSGTKKRCVQALRIPPTSSRPRATLTSSKVHECQTTKQKQATFRAKSAAGQADQCDYLEFCPDFTQEQYFRALKAKLGKGTVY
ncbi:hypothetical protein LAZ67_12002139 [Cordylochernes scorpioides]|uniref:Uncharacterized protein n=1 Tax=Cordylochernes scorpioides TaxID=51811 RepID=A0ABY6L1L4_9ARAC|nr:hypothetical protein LAZ67_12002139 [Cordylochernes scorpioides]